MSSFSNNSSLQTQFNESPYWDDYTLVNNYLRLLFNPERGVQARELTQSQTIINNQITRFANHIFKDGSKVAGGEHVLDLNAQYVRLRDTNALGNTVSVNNYLNKEITGATSGVTAYVVEVEDGSEAANPDTKTLIVKYLGANTAGAKSFTTGEALSANNGFTARVFNSGSPCGNASIFTVKEGIIYAKGFFVHHPEQTIVLEKYSKYPTYRVGYNVTEAIVTSSTDDSLLDPAQGASAYQSPGADRLQLTATLVKVGPSETANASFIEIMSIKSGVVQTLADRPQYSDIRDELARRTFDESGDYVVRGLTVKLREHLDDGENLGWIPLADGGNTERLAIGVEPGTAYIKGYDFESLVTRYLSVSKGIDYKVVEGLAVSANYGSYVLVNELVGVFDAYQGAVVSLYDTAEDRLTLRKGSTTSPAGAKIGEARVRAVVYDSGTPGTPAAVYRLYLYDIRMSSGAFTAVKHIYLNNVSLADGGADPVLEGGLAVLYESGFRSLVHPIPLKAMRTIRDVNDQIDFVFPFIASFNVTITAAGTFSVSTASDEIFPFSAGALNTTQKRSNFHVVLNAAAESANILGTVAVGTSSNVVSGVGTNFTSVFAVGDHIKVGGTTKRITVLTSANSLQVDSNWGSTASLQKAVRYYYAGSPIDFGGNGRDAAARSISIASSTSASFDLSEDLNGSVSATVLCNLRKVDGQEKAKVLRASRYVVIRCSTHSANTVGPWCLGFSDVFRINSVRQKSGAFSSPSEGTLVTDDFLLDDGQRDGFYDLANLKKGTASLSSGDYLLVNLDYFYHDTSQGDGYLTVDSYPIDDVNAANTAAISTKEIPLFKSPVTGAVYDLRDSIDARPIMAITASDSTTVGSASTNPTATSAFQLGLKGLYTPQPNESYTFDASYYLGRKDLVLLDPQGSLRTIKGVPSLYPITPETPADSMTLAVAEITPYPSLPPNISADVGRPDYACRVRFRANKRYTMRDIGVIDQRVTNLEYYNSLSLLERETSEMKILDDAGLDRFKNGFIVDPFHGSAVANIYDPEYAAAIDPKRKELRPMFEINSVGMEYANTSTNIYRAAKDVNITLASGGTAFSNGEIVYQGANLGAASARGTLRYSVSDGLVIEAVTGTFANTVAVKGNSSAASVAAAGIFTPSAGELALLPYTHSIFFEQSYATTTRNCAGLMYNWVGMITLTPDGDYWTDTTQIPETRINFDGNLDAWTWLVNAWGTEWGDWQTRWTGQEQVGQQEISEGARSTSEWTGGGILTRSFEDFRIETTVRTTTDQTRQGIKYSAIPETITQNTGNRVVDVTVQPYMRSRLVMVRAEGLKPNSRIYAFFDSEAVSSYVTPINTAAWELLKTYSPDNRTSGAAVPVQSITSIPMNVSGFNSAWLGVEGANLTTDSAGRFIGIFRVPNDSAKRFSVGTKTFRLSDSVTNSSVPGQVTTSGEVRYTATGLQQTVQDTVISSREVHIVQNNTSENRVVQSLTTNISRGTRQTGESFEAISSSDGGSSSSDGGSSGDGGEPVAQSFLVRIDTRSSAGFFVTKVDFYFATKHATLPLIVEIREMENSNVMTSRVVPFSQIVVPSSDVRTSTDGSIPTTIVFPSPVFLSSGYEYAIVLKPGANNPDYSIWLAEIGQTDVRTGQRVSISPFMGTLFASANDRTYQPQQLEDAKMRLYIAQFDTAVTGTVYMQNQRKEYLTLANTTQAWNRIGEQVRGEPTVTLGAITGTANVGFRIQGNSSGAYGIVSQANNVSRVYRLKNMPRGTAFTAGEAITVKTAGGVNAGSTGNNLTYTQPYGYVDHYFDTAANTALHLAQIGASSFKVGMEMIGQTSNTIAYIESDLGLKMNLFHPQVRQIVLPNTNIDWSAKTTTSDLHVIDTTWSQIAANADNETATERKVLSATDEDDDLAGARSLQLRAQLTTVNPFVSPVIDLMYAGAIVVHNIINNDSTGETLARGGSAKARYISRKVTLADDQDAEDLKVYLTLYQPPTTTVKVYAKFLHGEDSTLFDDRPWVEMVRTGSSYSLSENRNDFREAEFNLPTASLTGSNGEVQYTVGSVTFTGYKYFAIKIVMLAENSSLIPRERDLRGIGLQK